MGVNKSVPQFNEVTTLSPENLLHAIVNNVDKKIKWSNVVSQIDDELDITSTFATIAVNITTLNSLYTTLDSSVVHKAGNETITGTKIFSVSPKVPDTPADGDSAVNKDWVLSQITNSGIDGTITAGHILVAVDGDTVEDSRITQDATKIQVLSPSGSSLIEVANSANIMKTPSVGGFSVITTSAFETSLNFSDASHSAHVLCNGSYIELSHPLKLNLDSPDIELTDLSANCVLVSNGSKYIRTISALDQKRGGTGSTTAPDTGAIPIQGASKAYTYDAFNFNYDSALKRLNINNVYITPDDGLTGLTVEAAGNCLVLNALDAGYEGIIIEAQGGAIKVDSASGIAGKFTSAEYGGEFNQQGIITSDVDFPGVSINRTFTRSTGSSAKATGPCHLVNDTTSAAMGTGPGYRYVKDDITRWEVPGNGKAFTNLQTDIKVTQAGSLDHSVAVTSNVGSTTINYFSRTIKASTLADVGDEIVAKYYLSLAQATTQKQFMVQFGGTTIYSGTIFALTNTAGTAEIIVSIIKTATNTIGYCIKCTATDSSSAAPIIVEFSSGTLSKTLTSDQTLNLVGYTGSGATNGAITSIYAKYLLNPAS